MHLDDQMLHTYWHKNRSSLLFSSHSHFITYSYLTTSIRGIMFIVKVENTKKIFLCVYQLICKSALSNNMEEPSVLANVALAFEHCTYLHKNLCRQTKLEAKCITQTFDTR